MKKILLLFCATLMLALGTTSCGDDPTRTWSKSEIEEICSESFNTLHFDIVNPAFSNVAEVTDCQEAVNECYSIDSIFRTLPVSTLKRVADVCINKSGTTDKKQIVREYLKNISVYSNMSENLPPTSTKDEKAATDSGGSAVTKDDGSEAFETSFNYYTDTVTGKKVQVKTIKSYVRP